MTNTSQAVPLSNYNDNVATDNRRAILVALARLVGERSTIEAHTKWLDNAYNAGTINEDVYLIDHHSALSRLAELDSKIESKREELKLYGD